MLEISSRYSVKEQCGLLSVNRSCLYYQQKPQTPEKLKIYNKIDEIYTEFPYYGSRRITVVLNQAGHEISKSTTAKYMSEMGLEAIYPKKIRYGCQTAYGVVFHCAEIACGVFDLGISV